ncbi:hemerythrin domain-containing protein [Nocardia sp. NBC_01009]|uniref:hemerythrin domain-containing protein n=1 Tax=Nocardia sp. NBC_01009 TaxID=2975996 RepID=UPI003867AEFC|nr:hemerythrin domain-containing protein [Nocardia sp. NBC_01009]
MPDNTPAPATNRSVDRVRALGRELTEVHQDLRTELRRVRIEFDRYLAGDEVPPMRLRTHCTAFCAALTRHHTSEDTTAFPALGNQFPELAPVLAELSADHHLVADILRRLQQLLAEVGPDNADTAKRELDGLAAILESHFQWEERRLVEAFDALEIAASTGEQLFGVTVCAPAED